MNDLSDTESSAQPQADRPAPSNLEEGVKIYDRPERRLAIPAWLLILFLLLSAVAWFVIAALR